MAITAVPEETCADCGKPMVRSTKAWRTIDPALWDQLVPHSAHGICQRCVKREKDRQRIRPPLVKSDHDGSPLPPQIFRRAETYSFRYRDGAGKQRFETRDTLDAAIKAQAVRKAEAAEWHEKLAARRRQLRSQARQASMTAEELATERRLLKMEAALAEVQRERARAQRAARKLLDSSSPSERAIGKSYSLMRKLMQAVDSGAKAAEGLRAVRLRAAYDSLREAEEEIIAAVFGNETEQRGRFRAS